ncbi:oxygenase MpaB family protein [Daejeonella sp.]|uniref:oxygenase MpaB family protein n=1 Tax=Daejeonella sp. TaxID=2805397 RepID=UPI003983813E
MPEKIKYSDVYLDSRRLLADPDADTFVEEVFADPIRKKKLQEWMMLETSSDALDQLKLDYPHVSFISNSADLPDWAEPELMCQGSAFFARHSEMIMSLLGLLSLPYCYTAAKGAMVLHLTELIRKQTTKRLFDTAIFIWEVLAPGAFDEKGKAFAEILKVRIIHAFVRQYILSNDKWDQAWGLPVNQEDMAGTNLSFSLIVIRGLRKLGYRVSKSDEEAFLHIWAVIGFLSGLEKELIPENPIQAELLDGRIKHRQFASSVHGKELTYSLIGHILSVNESKATANDIRGLMRYLLGDEISEQLAIDSPALPAYKLILIRLLGAVKSVKPPGDLNRKYKLAFSEFKLRNPALTTNLPAGRQPTTNNQPLA